MKEFYLEIICTDKTNNSVNLFCPLSQCYK